MLLRTIGLVSVILATTVCSLTGAFADLSRIWLLPVSFAGFYLVGLAAAFVYLWYVSSKVDFDVPQENDDPHYRKIVALYVEALIMLLQAKVHPKGLEKTPKDGRFLLVCNHQFLADPGILLHYFKDSQLAFISKQENKDMFAVGRLMHKILCQTIDRSDDRQALKAIIRCIQIIKEDKASIAVFPEGGTNSDDKLHHFRPGVFKIAQKANVPIVVCTINNTRPIIHNGLRLKKTHVDLHLVDVIQPEELQGRTTVEISDRVYRMMLDDLGAEFAYQEQNT